MCKGMQYLGIILLVTALLVFNSSLAIAAGSTEAYPSTNGEEQTEAQGEVEEEQDMNWVSVGTDDDSFSFAVGLRKENIGLEFGCIFNELYRDGYGPMYGGDLLIFCSFGNLSVYAGPGFYWQEHTSYEFNRGFSYGVQLKGRKNLFGFGSHNLRGVNLKIGFKL